MGSKKENVAEVAGIEDVRDVESKGNDSKGLTTAMIHQEHKELYLEALQKYPINDAIDRDAEKRLIRKLDMRILPLLGICYFFYVSNLRRYSHF
jgi:hypothetical protein